MNQIVEPGWKFSRKFNLGGEVFVFEANCGQRRVEANSQGVKLLHENSFNRITGICVSWAVFQSVIATLEYAKLRKTNEWAEFDIRRISMFGFAYYVRSPGQREMIKVGEQFKNGQAGLTFTEKNEIREKPMPFEVCDSTTASHDIWRVASEFTPFQGWIIGEVISLPDACRMEICVGSAHLIVADGTSFELSSMTTELNPELLKMIEPLYTRLQGAQK